MKIVGIVAEYNPFHLGHRHLLDAVRDAYGADCTVVCCMSGNFVQRGEPALLDKWKRAELALAGGVDLILELPTPYAVSSAQRFARSAVGVLAATGLVEVLAFGSETGDLSALNAAAACLEQEDYRQALRHGLDLGLPFAAARARAVRACAGEAARCLEGANDILAVEYLDALRALNVPLTPFAVPRMGAGHDEGVRAGLASASAVRALLRVGRTAEALSYLPEPCRALLEGAEPSDFSRCERAVLARLRSMGEADYLALPDCGEGLHRRLMAAARETSGLAQLMERAKTKRYTMARIRRAVLWAFLGLNPMEVPPAPPYLKVLGFSGRGQEALRRMKRTAALPVLTRSAHGKKLTGGALRLLEAESRCTDLYGLTLPEIPPCGREWREGPIVAT